VAAEALHITLCFLGWQPEREIAAIGAACGIVAAEPEVELAVRQPAWLPPRRPRVLAVRLADDAGALERIHTALSRALAAGGWYQPEKRAYLAHVTVARVRDRTGGQAGGVRGIAGAGGVRGIAGAGGVRGIAGAELPALPSLTFRGSRVVLYRSRLHRSGARYEGLAEVLLRSSRA
jgi:2'-5' RNA ligase